MIVKGTETRQVEVNVNEMELLRGLANHFGCSEPLFDEDYDTRWIPEYDSVSHDLSALRAEVDISHHGSPTWEPTGRKITDEISLRAYTHLKELLRIMEENRGRM